MGKLYLYPIRNTQFFSLLNFLQMKNSLFFRNLILIVALLGSVVFTSCEKEIPMPDNTQNPTEQTIQQNEGDSGKGGNNGQHVGKNGNSGQHVG